MSRFCDDYDDEDFPNQAQLWRANTDRALAGKKGQAFLKEMEGALLSLPRPRLIEGYICKGGDVCAMGALALKRQRKAGDSISAALYWLEKDAPGEDDVDATASYMSRNYGVLRRLSFELAWVNDEGRDCATPEQRYAAVLKWIREKMVKT